MNRLTLLTAGLLIGSVLPSQARDCRPAEAPPGVRVPLPAGCEPGATKAPPKSRQTTARSGQDSGFIDLGNGSQVRISGRVRVDVRSRP
jgi:hypothetical protein